MIQQENNIFVLSTKTTTYAFRVTETGHLEHLYYGKKIRLSGSAEALIEKHAFAPGNTINYDDNHKDFTLEDMCLEMSAYGKGDVREPFVEVLCADGSSTVDFLYESHEISMGKPEFKTLPGSYDEKQQTEHLCVTLKDANSGLHLELHYYLYEDCDVISRSSRLINDSHLEILLTRLLSFQLDMPTADWCLTHFNGSWGREMAQNTISAKSGKFVNASYTGTSSNRANPFVMMHGMHTTEEEGECFGLNLIYSGNHYEAIEVNGFGKTRLVTGINPQNFRIRMLPGDDFEAPEAVMTYSVAGFNGMSANMHTFVREHIVRGTWKKKVRPILLNSWEAAYFDINENKLLNLARAAKEVGVELFVMDDGWFGERDDDTSSLGDWTENLKKLPGGLKSLVDKVKALGLDFGIWVEPEMVNVKSKLYEAHPEWVLQIPGKAHSEGRNQRILDMGNPEVQEYVIAEMTRVFSSADISYVKWDMNRIFTDYYAQCLPADRQGEVMHRYQLGLYRCMKELTESFPDILFEGCCSGGNRFDLGILCYFPQIWASDNTDAICRAQIQNGYSYGYPQSVYTAHVSACPNHQTLRTTPIETRFDVAAFGVFGYECNLCDMKKDDLAAVKAQIELYKEWREVFQFGQLYRGRSFDAVDENFGNLKQSAGNIAEWTCVSVDKRKAVGMQVKRFAVPNAPFERYLAKGLDPDAEYHFYNRILKVNVKEFGDLVNTIAPIHIKQDSLLHNIVAHFVKMEGETEDYLLYGDMLMNAGVKLKQNFGGTGYNNEVRHFQDFGSRLYFMESEEA